MAKNTPPKTPPVEPKKLGRPSAYPDEIWEQIIDRHSEGETITAICKAEAFPTVGWVSRKAADDVVFGKRLARAREMFMDAKFDEAIEIADGTGHEKPRKADGTVDLLAAKADVHRDRLRVATRLQVCAKGNPAKYGDRVAVHHSGAIDMTGVDDATLNTRIEKKLYELGVAELFKSWSVTAAKIEAFFALFRVTELPTAPAPVRLLPGEKEADL